MALFAISAAVCLGFASMAVDIGLSVYEKAKIVNAADSAALAGAQELPGNSDKAIEVARGYLARNGIDPDTAEITIVNEGTGISINAAKDFRYFLAGVLGMETGQVNAIAIARALPVTAVSSGTRPFAIEDMVLAFGEEYILKEGGGDGSNGNYGALALGGNGANNYWYNIVNGYNGQLEVGQYIDTEPGNMSGPTRSGINTLINSCSHSPKCTFDSFDPGCPRIVTVVIVDSFDVNGRGSVRITGFASFFLDDVDGHGNDSIVRGRFIRTVTAGETSETQTDYGLRGISLVR